MAERRKGEGGGTYVPPTPENTKPHGSRDNAVEMGAGGKHEREALDTQRDKMADPARATDDPGRTDNPLGTGVGYAGEGSADYGEQEKRMSTSANSPKRTDEADDSATTRRQPEQQHHSHSSGQKPGTGGSGGQQSTGGMPPTQGTGSTPQSHTPRPSSAETGAQHGTTNTPSPTSGAKGDTEANKGTIGGTQDHGTVKTPQGQNVSTQGQGPAAPSHPKPDDTKSQTQNKVDDAKSAVQEKTVDLKGQAQDKADDIKNAAQERAGDLKDQAQDKAGDLKDQTQTRLTDMRGQAQGAFDDAKTQAQGKFDAVTGQAQDTLESVRANLQTRTDSLKETVTGRTDQLVGAVGEKGDLAKQTANEKSTQAGEKLTGFADTIREKTQTLEADHPVANAATKAAGAFEQTGTYLQQSTPDDWMGDLKQLISRKPVESVLVAAGLGYMVARAFRK